MQTDFYLKGYCPFGVDNISQTQSRKKKYCYYFHYDYYSEKLEQTTKDQFVSAKVSDCHVSYVDTVNPASCCWYSEYLVCVCVYCRVGKVVNIIAKVNRAFTSSMEVSGSFFS